MEVMADSLLLKLSVMKKELEDISKKFSKDKNRNDKQLTNVRSVLNFLRIIKGCILTTIAAIYIYIYTYNVHRTCHVSYLSFITNTTVTI